MAYVPPGYSTRPGQPDPNRPGYVYGNTPDRSNEVHVVNGPNIAPDAPGGANNPISLSEARSRYGSDAGVNVSGVPTHQETAQESLANDLLNPSTRNLPQVQQYAKENPAVAQAANQQVELSKPVSIPLSNPNQFSLANYGVYQTKDAKGRDITIQNVNGDYRVSGTSLTSPESIDRLSQIGFRVQTNAAVQTNPKTAVEPLTYKGTSELALAPYGTQVNPLEGFLTRPVASTYLPFSSVSGQEGIPAYFSSYIFDQPLAQTSNSNTANFSAVQSKPVELTDSQKATQTQQNIEKELNREFGTVDIYGSLSNTGLGVAANKISAKIGSVALTLPDLTIGFLEDAGKPIADAYQKGFTSLSKGDANGFQLIASAPFAGAIQRPDIYATVGAFTVLAPVLGSAAISVAGGGLSMLSAANQPAKSVQAADENLVLDFAGGFTNVAIPALGGTAIESLAKNTDFVKVLNPKSDTFIYGLTNDDSLARSGYTSSQVNASGLFGVRQTVEGTFNTLITPKLDGTFDVEMQGGSIAYEPSKVVPAQVSTKTTYEYPIDVVMQKQVADDFKVDSAKVANLISQTNDILSQTDVKLKVNSIKTQEVSYITGNEPYIKKYGLEPETRLQNQAQTILGFEKFNSKSTRLGSTYGFVEGGIAKGNVLVDPYKADGTEGLAYTVAHEFGHVFGLDHVEPALPGFLKPEKNLMFPAATEEINPDLTFLQKRTIRNSLSDFKINEITKVEKQPIQAEFIPGSGKGTIELLDKDYYSTTLNSDIYIKGQKASVSQVGLALPSDYVGGDIEVKALEPNLTPRSEANALTGKREILNEFTTETRPRAVKPFATQNIEQARFSTVENVRFDNGKELNVNGRGMLRQPKNENAFVETPESFIQVSNENANLVERPNEVGQVSFEKLAQNSGPIEGLPTPATATAIKLVQNKQLEIVAPFVTGAKALGGLGALAQANNERQASSKLNQTTQNQNQRLASNFLNGFASKTFQNQKTRTEPRTRVQPESSTLFDLLSLTETRTAARSLTGTRTAMDVSSIFEPVTTTRSATSTRTVTEPRTQTTVRSSPAFPVNVIIEPNPGFGFPSTPLNIGEYHEKRKPKRASKQTPKYQYTNSIAAEEFNLRAKKQPNLVSGFEVRPFIMPNGKRT